MPRKHNARQDAIRDIVRTSDVRTQRELVDALHAREFTCTQATVSRDITTMGLRKLPSGTYALPEDLHLKRMASDLVDEVVCAGNLVLVKAQPGTGSGIAAAVDGADLPDILGSIAGDDTVLLITKTAEDGSRVEAQLRAICGLEE